MTERPIIFSAPMVLALLAGRKTQTRRVLKPQPVCSAGIVPSFLWGRFGGIYPDDWFGFGNEIDGALPYAPRDRLWVREAWRARHAIDKTPPSEMAADESTWWEADGASCRGLGDKSGRLRPSTHMPRWASRLTLTVTDVRVQRLHEISEADAVAEGVEPYPYTEGEWWVPSTTNIFPTACGAFIDLWGSIHGTGSWDENPWVCAISFTVEHRNIDA